MSRAEYCRQQAQLCRDIATQLSNRSDVIRLSELAQNYEEEANCIGSVAVEGRPELPLRNKH
jgi:hypothetical protein